MSQFIKKVAPSSISLFSSSTGVIGTLNGVTFTITSASDPMQMSISQPITGQFVSYLTYAAAQLANADNVGIDQWIPGGSSGGGATIVRAKAYSNNQNVNFALNNAGYVASFSGHFVTQGKQYVMHGQSMAGLYRICITAV
jgi:hypothetical protein